MATTVGSFSAIDDTEVDAESPITETLVTRMRDNSYWIDAGTRRTTITDTTKVLKPDGAGGVTWGTGGVNGTKGSGALGTTSGTATQISEVSGGVLKISITGTAPAGSQTHITFAEIHIQQSNGTYNGISERYGTSYTCFGPSGTLTASFVAIASFGDGTTTSVFARQTGGNIELYTDSATQPFYSYIWL